MQAHGLNSDNAMYVGDFDQGHFVATKLFTSNWKGHPEQGQNEHAIEGMYFYRINQSPGMLSCRGFLIARGVT